MDGHGGNGRVAGRGRRPRVEKVDLPEPYQLETLSRKILVIGGGITGMSAAIDAAKAGYDVTIVEKEAQLGGQANNW